MDIALKKANIRNAARRGIIRVILLLIFFFLIFQLGTLFLPGDFESWIRRPYMLVFVFGAILYLGYKEYKFFRSDDFAAIYEATRGVDRETALASLKSLALFKETHRNIAEKKLELMKFYSPIPILIYALGVYLDKKPILSETINFIIVKTQVSEALKYLGFGLFFVYIFLIVDFFNSYKNLSFDYCFFQSRVFEYENKSRE
ncbi:MAG: hypothetical protein P4L49_13275 [Desulfosporosinus sp.]|nr:hypothetical protein [Desulfosporosinus sp.]